MFHMSNNFPTDILACDCDAVLRLLFWTFTVVTEGRKYTAAVLKFEGESSLLLRTVGASSDGGPLTYDNCKP